VLFRNGRATNRRRCCDRAHLGSEKPLETMLRYLADMAVKDSTEAMETAARRLAIA